MKKKQGGGVEEKRKTPSAENEVKRDQEGPEKKTKARKGEANIKDVAVQRVREELERWRKERSKAMHRSDGDASEAMQKGKVAKMKMIEKMKR